MDIGSIVKGHVNEALGLNDDLKEKRMKIVQNKYMVIIEDVDADCKQKQH